MLKAKVQQVSKYEPRAQETGLKETKLQKLQEKELAREGLGLGLSELMYLMLLGATSVMLLFMVLFVCTFVFALFPQGGKRGGLNHSIFFLSCLNWKILFLYKLTLLLGL